MSRPAEAYRDFDHSTESVRAFYQQNHQRQTVDFVREKKRQYLPLGKRKMSVWEAVEFLDTVVDDSDPDMELSQLAHATQTAEAMRADDAPPWLVLTGFVHDLGKVLCMFDEPQWAVVGDTFPVGCAFSEQIVYPDYFSENPDSADPRYAGELGIYTAGCGLDAIQLSWGHDEYLYHVMAPYLPSEALAIIRYHSFYAWHQEGAYARMMNAGDHEKLAWVKRFNQYDLYSKSEDVADWQRLRPYYEALVSQYLPASLQW